MSKYYNLELRLNQYTNDKEYRETLRQLFSMQKVVAHCEEIDDITNDENDTLIINQKMSMVDQLPST